jgi:poly-gamma-glutamate synthesis protein (capsule biosynthesis protein)
VRLRIALAGDTMLGRGVGALLAERPDRAICSPEIVEVARSADLFVLNLECCISDRGERWPDPFKPFFFRAPPAAAETLAAIGVDAVTLANNHALDYGPAALLDTLAHLEAVGIAHAGAGADVRSARRPALIERAGASVALLSLSDHPRDFAAGEGRPGIAYADLARGVPPWVRDGVARSEADVVLVSPHWGPNMAASPVPHVRACAADLAGAGATVLAGHSAHVFQGVDVRSGCAVLYDLGDFVDDYAVDDVLRNDLGLLWLVTLEDRAAVRLDVLPLRLGFASTTVARGRDRAWILERLRSAVHPLEVREAGGMLRVDLGNEPA